MTLTQLKALCKAHGLHTFEPETMEFFSAKPVALCHGPGGTFYAERQKFGSGPAFGVLKRVTIGKKGRPEFTTLAGGPNSILTPTVAHAEAQARALAKGKA